eukprot:CAMPEP_0202434544 /NCGR_PEP_ID=MMETSP1345-20130828/15446_1 /ASSEMBLY_ACC=CAM_ASM_000843 /TAXON_ID=342563 /ORGANISM="Fabrea Fabrea salina" /LENGTH=45 /DNA_ID= /DNA_START= /DNA_END= /DNA_ORIENTATION=
MAMWPASREIVKKVEIKAMMVSANTDILTNAFLGGFSETMYCNAR